MFSSQTCSVNDSMCGGHLCVGVLTLVNRTGSDYSNYTIETFLCKPLIDLCNIDVASVED